MVWASLMISKCYLKRKSFFLYQVTNFKLAQNFTANIISGPSRSHGLPAFSWEPKFKSNPHVGLPNVYKFDWLTTMPSLV